MIQYERSPFFLYRSLYFCVLIHFHSLVELESCNVCQLVFTEVKLGALAVPYR